MKIKIYITALIVSVLSSCGTEKIAIAGEGWDEIAIVNKGTGLIEWKHSLSEGEECNDIEVTPKGDVLYAYKGGARLMSRKHEVLWDYKAGENEEIHSATRLKEGGYLLGVCGEPSRIVELDEKGQQTKEFKFPTLVFDVHEQFRHVYKTDSFYYVPIMSRTKIMRLSLEEGRLRGTVSLMKHPYAMINHSSGTIITSCGVEGKILIINPALKQLDNYKEIEIKGASLMYPAEIQMLDNNNLLIANSNKSGNDLSQPLILEINDKYEVVWSLPYNQEIKNVTSVYRFKE